VPRCQFSQIPLKNKNTKYYHPPFFILAIETFVDPGDSEPRPTCEQFLTKEHTFPVPETNINEMSLPNRSEALSMNELTQSGIERAEAHAQNAPEIKGLDASKLTIFHTTTPRKVPDLDSKEVWSFKECTDHQVMVKWTEDEGWHAPEIKP
jgi:hypothetical protein